MAGNGGGGAGWDGGVELRDSFKSGEGSSDEDICSIFWSLEEEGGRMVGRKEGDGGVKRLSSRAVTQVTGSCGSVIGMGVEDDEKLTGPGQETVDVVSSDTPSNFED